ncbi:zinc-dependent alcohol dehydrogenase family protein [Rubellimicrobium roseum]|uniref:Zinc-dependent alcohol dehydrogenase family protein n=1 Tax=Rubellimicrobium roseum TaxID=687525 RepID=A0A5C4NDH8_9RHOB|nr:zinc-dependent alcohol dehydrogenase family protein [Rubellimicrobium roseum]TNC71980.1 zinc-dependent alcohol dehydrogenase family protein [Rubellimicrobium roseum]
MQAVRFMEVGRVELGGIPEPSPARGEVVVKVAHAGVCGTDRHILWGEFPSRPPVVLGHEFAGTVVAIGEGVTTHRVGDRVACDPNIACGACPSCLRGRINLCENLVAVGIQRDGGFAELSGIPAHRAIPLPEGMGLRAAAFSEPLACCVHALDIAAIRPGERAIVIGGGVIGLLCVQLARLAGAEVLLLTRSPARQRIGGDVGAQHAVASPVEARALWPRGADVVLECAGVAETMTEAPQLAGRGGRVVIVGVLAQGEQIAIEPFDLLVREVDLRMAFVNPFTQARAIGLLASGAVRTDPLVTREVGREEIPAILHAKPGPTEVKVMVTA